MCSDQLEARFQLNTFTVRTVKAFWVIVGGIALRVTHGGD